MASLLPWVKARFFDDNGAPLAGGKLYSYSAGTSSPVATYTDQSLGTANTNPVVLDANGEANVWLDNGFYKFVLADSADVVKWTVDEVESGTQEESSVWIPHAVIDGQGASNLLNETIDFSVYSSALYDYEIRRGTTVMANGRVAIQNLSGVGRVVEGESMTMEDHGVTFSITQLSTVAQLQAALSVGPGSGTIKLSRRMIPV